MGKVIETADGHAAAMERLSILAEGDPAPGSAEASELELLAHSVEAYEQRHHDLGLPDPLTAIVFRMEQQGLSRTDMVPYFGSESRVAEILDGRRALTVDMIHKLHRELEIPAESLLGDLGCEDVIV